MDWNAFMDQSEVNIFHQLQLLSNVPNHRSIRKHLFELLGLSQRYIFMISSHRELAYHRFLLRTLKIVVW
jgi:hypothetical protein